MEAARKRMADRAELGKRTKAYKGAIVALRGAEWTKLTGRDLKMLHELRAEIDSKLDLVAAFFQRSEI